MPDSIVLGVGDGVPIYTSQIHSNVKKKKSPLRAHHSYVVIYWELIFTINSTVKPPYKYDACTHYCLKKGYSTPFYSITFNTAFMKGISHF